MNYTFIVRYFILAAGIITVSSCGNHSSESDIAGTDSVENVNSAEGNAKAQNVFYSIPSPIETTSLLKGAGAKYNAGFLNPIENVSKYASAASRALNLGVYGTDLSFTSIFDQTQESMLYLRCANKLASSLGISGAFDESTTSRIEANLDNRDSLLTIISDSYWNADKYLKENGQPGVSALIIAGGWIEGLYIAVQVAKTTKNEDIESRIAKQKKSLDNLTALLDTYKKTNAGVNDMYNQVLELKTLFDGIDIKTADTNLTGAKESVLADSTGIVKLTPVQFKAISDKAAAIRNKIIQ